MASAVQIQITVDSGQSVQAIQAVEGALTKAGIKGQASMQQAGAGVQELGGHAAKTLPQLEKMDAALGTVGVKAEGSLKKAGDGAHAMGGHISTSLDSVRLLSQEFGLRLPRAIESMLARMPAVTNAIGGVLGGLAAIAAAQVFLHVAQEAYGAYKQFIDLNAEAEKFYQTLKKTSQEDVGNTHSIETTNRRLSDVQTEYRTDDPAARSLHSGAGAQLGQGDLAGAVAMLMSAKSLSKEGAVAAGQILTLTKQGVEQKHAEILAQIEINHALDGTLGKQAQINAEMNKAMEISSETRDFNRKVEMAMGNVSPGTAGAAEQLRRDRLAQAENTAKTILNQRAERDTGIAMQNEAVNAGLLGQRKLAEERKQALDEVKRKVGDGAISDDLGKAETAALGLKFHNESMALSRTERDARINMENAALDAGLEGEQKLLAERQQAIDAVTRKFHDGEITRQTALAETAALGQKFDNERDMRLAKQFQEARQAMRTAEQSGLTGGARIAAEHDNAIQKVNTDRDLDPAVASEMRLAAAVTATQKMKELEDNFADHVKGLEDTRVEATLGGFAKIDAATKRQMDELKKLYDQDFENAQLNDAQKLQAAANNQTALNAINAAAAQQKTELAARNQADDLRADQEAARAEARVREDGAFGWVAAYKNGITEIEAAEAERMAKLHEDITKEGLSWDEISRRKTDIERQANAEIAQQNQQLQHQIASNLQSAFTDPIGFIKSRMEQMMFEIIAGWIMHMQVFKQLFGTTMGGLTPGAPGAAASTATGPGGAVSAAIRAATGIAGGGAPSASAGMPSAATAAAPGGMPGTRGIVNGVADISSIYGNISGAAASIPKVDDGGFNGPMTGDTPDMTPAQQAAQQASGAGGSNLLGQAGAVGMGGFTLEQGTVKAFEGDDPLGGAMTDGAAGMTIGAAFGGPMGALIGGAAGAALGAGAGIAGYVTGMGGNMSARTYYRQQVFPQLEQDYQSAGSGDFQSEIANANKTAADAMGYMSLHFGRSSAQWVDDNYMKKELQRVTMLIASSAEGGRFAVTHSANQFHTGGRISGFGTLGTSADEGFIHAMLGETVMNREAALAHGPMLDALNAGASASDIASKYLAGSAPMERTSGASYRSGDIHLHTLDTKTMAGWLRDGGAQLISKHQNDFAGEYAGDGVRG